MGRTRRDWRILAVALLLVAAPATAAAAAATAAASQQTAINRRLLGSAAASALPLRTQYGDGRVLEVQRIEKFSDLFTALAKKHPPISQQPLAQQSGGARSSDTEPAAVPVSKTAAAGTSALRAASLSSGQRQQSELQEGKYREIKKFSDLFPKIQRHGIPDDQQKPLKGSQDAYKVKAATAAATNDDEAAAGPSQPGQAPGQQQKAPPQQQGRVIEVKRLEKLSDLFPSKKRQPSPEQRSTVIDASGDKRTEQKPPAAPAVDNGNTAAASTSVVQAASLTTQQQGRQREISGDKLAAAKPAAAATSDGNNELHTASLSSDQKQRSQPQQQTRVIEVTRLEKLSDLFPPPKWPVIRAAGGGATGQQQRSKSEHGTKLEIKPLPKLSGLFPPIKRHGATGSSDKQQAQDSAADDHATEGPRPLPSDQAADKSAHTSGHQQLSKPEHGTKLEIKPLPKLGNLFPQIKRRQSSGPSGDAKEPVAPWPKVAGLAARLINGTKATDVAANSIAALTDSGSDSSSSLGPPCGLATYGSSSKLPCRPLNATGQAYKVAAEAAAKEVSDKLRIVKAAALSAPPRAGEPAGKAAAVSLEAIAKAKAATAMARMAAAPPKPSVPKPVKPVATATRT